MHDIRVWLYLVCALIASTASAEQTINGVKLSAIGQGQATILPNGTVISSVGFRAQVGSAPPKFYDRAVNFTKGQTGASIKKFAKGNAFQIGLTVGILGIGWVMDELTGQIYTSQGTAPEPLAGWSWRNESSVPYAWGSTPMASASYSVGKVLNGYTTTSIQSCGNYTSPPAPYTVVQCVALRNLAGNPDFTISVSYRGTPIDAINANPSTPPTPATDEQVATQVVPQLQPQALPKLHTDPVTGAVEENQAVLDKMTEIANEVAKLNDPANTPVAPPVATVTGTTTTPAVGSDTPSFCIYATVVCDFIDWFKSDPVEPEGSNWTVAGMITENEIEVESYSSGLGSGSCPNPESFSVLGGSFEYSYQPICDLAGTARIFVLLFAYLSSIYILLGMKRS